MLQALRLARPPTTDKWTQIRSPTATTQSTKPKRQARRSVHGRPRGPAPSAPHRVWGPPGLNGRISRPYHAPLRFQTAVGSHQSSQLLPPLPSPSFPSGRLLSSSPPKLKSSSLPPRLGFRFLPRPSTTQAAVAAWKQSHLVALDFPAAARLSFLFGRSPAGPPIAWGKRPACSRPHYFFFHQSLPS